MARRSMSKCPHTSLAQWTFENGAVATVMTSFDVWEAELPRIEIYGSKGSLSVPDPNTFGGPVRLLRSDSE